jgi:hypothetical protein
LDVRVVEFRWKSQAVAGAWCKTLNAALYDAMKHGQAFLNPGKGHIITLRPFASIEERADTGSPDAHLGGISGQGGREGASAELQSDAAPGLERRRARAADGAARAGAGKR